MFFLAHNAYALSLDQLESQWHETLETHVITTKKSNIHTTLVQYDKLAQNVKYFDLLKQLQTFTQPPPSRRWRDVDLG